MSTRGLLTSSLIALWTRQQPETIRKRLRRTRLEPVACDTRTRANLYRAIDIPRSWHRRDTPNDGT